MDLSKLPGRTPSAATTQVPPGPPAQPPSPVAAVPDPRPVLPVEEQDRIRHVAPVGGDAYFAIGIGALLFLFFPRIFKFLSHELFGTAWRPYVLPNGTEVSYLTQNDFKSDLGIALFGAALILDGVILISLNRSRPATMAAAVLMGLATLYNAYIVVALMDGGLPVVSAVAVLFGGYGTFTLMQRANALQR